MPRIKSLLRLGIPYILVVLLPIVSVFSLGRVIINNYQEKIIDEKQRSIEIAFDRFEQRINAIQTISYTIVQSDTMAEYILSGRKNQVHSVTEIMKLKDLLQDYMVNEDIIFLYLYDTENQLIISNETALNDSIDFFQYKYQVEGYTAAERVEDQKNLSRGYRTAVKVGIGEKKSTNVIEYAISVPLKKIGNMDYELVLVMEAEDLFRDFLGLLDSGGAFYMYYQGERLIFSSSDKYEREMNNFYGTGLQLLEVDNEQMYGMICQSDDDAWQVEVYLPNLLQRGIWMSTNSNIWLLVIISVIASVVLCICFTHKNHKEIVEILSLYREKDNGQQISYIKDECCDDIGYMIIKKYAERTIRENDQFRKSMVGYKTSRKYEVLDKLVRGTYENNTEINELCDDVGLNVKNERCVVLCLHYDGLSYRTVLSNNLNMKDFVKEAVAVILEGRFEILDTSARETICLLAINDKNVEEAIHDIVLKLKVEVAYSYNIDLSIGVGNVVDSILDINTSYIQAREVIKYCSNCLSSEKKIFLYSELEQIADIYYYSSEYNEKICNYIQMGRPQDAKGIFLKIFKENFENDTRKLSEKAQAVVKNKIKNSLLDVAEKENVSIENKVGLLFAKTDIRRSLSDVYEIVDLISEKIGEKKNLIQKQSAQRIMDYVKENFCDDRLSLKQISYALELHENYISNLFKTVYGENLFVVIEKLRIEKACEMLKKTDMKISDIAENVGYVSDVSFRRAFKKTKGMSPKDYREKN